MYAPFFGLTHEPFSIAPDPRYLFMSERHREALAHLLYGLGERGTQGRAAGGAGGGFVLLSGEIGTGKTTVCRCFLEQIPAHCNVAYIFNPKLTVIELLQSVCEEFHITLPRSDTPATVKNHLGPLNAFLLQEHASGRNNVLIIDEAQNLSADVLEQLRLLTNLETSERKLLQIILIGQPELRTMLQRPELEQLAQRVIARYHLEALSESESGQYIRHRLEVAGLTRPLPFERASLRRIHQLSRGIPRRINLLCDRALLGAFAGGHATVGRAIVDQAASEVFDSPVASVSRRNRRAVVLGLWLAAGAGLVATAGYLTQRQPAPVVSASGGAAPAAATAASASVAPLVAAAAVAAVMPAPEASRGPVATATTAATTAPRTADPAPPPALLQNEDQAWRELALSWRIEPVEGPPCPALARQQVQCFTRVTSLALIRQLERPGFVMLDSRSAAPSYALLTGLTRDSATLRAAGTEQTVTLAALAARWQGDFSTLWRSPPGYDSRTPNLRSGPVIDWATARLALVDGVATPARPVLDRALTARLRAFQLAQGLEADGQLGPMTVMQLNRSAGVDEPRLRTEP